MRFLMSFLDALHRSIGQRPAYRQAFYNLEREGKVRGIESILRYLAEEDAVFQWMFGVRQSGMAG